MSEFALSQASSERAKSRYLIPSLSSAVRILQYLSQAKHANANLTQISRDLELNRSTTYRILTTLQKAAILEYDDNTHSYRLGPALAVLGARAISLNEFLHRAQTLIHRIAEETGNTTVLVQPVSSDKVAYVLKADPETDVHIGVRIGQTFPIAAGSYGKVFLAYMEKEQRERVLKKFSEPTGMADGGQFEQEWARIRSARMATCWEEHMPGVCEASVPIFRSGTQKVAAVVCAMGLTATATREQLTKWAADMRTLVDREFADVR